MAARDYTTTALLQAIRDDGTFPDTQSLLTDARLIRMAQRRLEDLVYPLLQGLHSEFFVKVVQTTVTASTVDIPTDGMANKLRYLKFRRDGDSSFYTLPQIDPSNVDKRTQSESAVLGFYFQGNQVVLWPATSPTGTVEMAYYMRPNQLTSTNNAGQVSSINSDTGRVTLSRLPSTFSVGETVCAQNQNPFFDLRFTSRSITNISSPSIFLSDVSSIVVGDWVCLENQAVIPQIPPEMMSVLITATVQKGHEAMENLNAAGTSQALLDNQIAYWTNFYSERAEGNPEAYGSFNQGIDSGGGYYGSGGIW